MATNEGEVTVREVMSHISLRSREMVAASLVAIYERPSGSDTATRQVGTGFLVALKGHSILVTARHVLYGHRYDEDPFCKHVVFNGRLRGLFELNSGEVLQDLNNDLVAMCADELPLDKCLSASSLLPGEPTCNLIAIHGFLASKFRRNIRIGALQPQPYFYINQRVFRGRGYTGVLYPKSKNRDARTGRIVHAPLPQGMSGCPMLDANRLARGQLSIVGVFTDYLQPSGQAFGESASKVIALLDQLTLSTKR